MNIPVTFKNEVIPASAGSGKTYRLTNRFISLMALGVEPERIIALTFTRKAAGEFFDEILKKLANSAKDTKFAKTLSTHLGDPEFNSQLARELLNKFIESMPRLELGTMDSFLYKIVSFFPFEMGLGSDFELLSEHDILIQKEEVYRRVFERSGAGGDEFLTAFKLATFGREDAGILRNLNDYVTDLHQYFLYSPEPNCWGNSRKIWGDDFPWKELSKDDLKDVTQNLLKSFKANKELKSDIVEKWESFFVWILEHSPGNPVPSEQKTLHNNLLKASSSLEKGSAKINVAREGHEIERHEAELVFSIASHLMGSQINSHASRTRGLWKVLKCYEDEYDKTVRGRGRLTFSDLSYYLSRGGSWSPLKGLDSALIEQIEYRMDAQYDHWLLDEFQDTSREQWKAIENLVDEAAQDAEAKRSVFVVGDLKQSIYGWRGGDPELFREQRKKYRFMGPERFHEESLDTSQRSSQPIIDMVNTVFGDNRSIAQLFPSVADLWEYEEHTTAHPQRSGYATWIATENEKGFTAKDKIECRLEIAAKIINHLNPIKHGLKIGVLVQRGNIGIETTKYLREHTNLKVTTEADIHIATDNPLTAALISLYRCAAHPGDLYAWGHLKMTPFLEVIEADFSDPWSLAKEIISSVWKYQFEATTRSWIEKLTINLDKFNLARAEQFCLAASVFDRKGNRSIDDFIRFMENYKVRDSSTNGTVQVMTIHKSKGLDFDAVILPEIDGSSLGSSRPGIKVKYDSNKNTEWILQMPNKAYSETDPRLSEFLSTESKDNCYEAICKFYVGLTRARFANYLISDEVDGKSKSTNFVRLLSETIKEEDQSSGTLYKNGDPDWFENNSSLPASEEEPKDFSPRPVPDESFRRNTIGYNDLNEDPQILSSKDLFDPSSQELPSSE